MRKLFAIAILSALGAYPQSPDPIGQEIDRGSLRIIWTRIDTNLIASLHSDDSDTIRFKVVLRYRYTSTDGWKTMVRSVDNDVSQSASPYWVPVTFRFPSAPSDLQYSIVEDKIEFLHPLM